MKEQKLFDLKYDNFVGTVADGVMTSRHGFSYRIDGWAIVDDNDDVCGTFVEGVLRNVYGQAMAEVRPSN